MGNEINHTLVDAFLLIAEEEGNTLSLEAIANAAFAKLANGESKSLVSTSLNGKSFSYNVSKPADELFAAVSLAIRKFNRGLLRVSTVDFSQL
jgi:hypothetical protein